MVDRPIKWLDALKRVGELAQEDDRLKPLPAVAKRKGWTPNKTAAVGEYLQKQLPALTGSAGTDIPELENLIEEAGKQFDTYMAKQALTKIKYHKRPKFR